MQIALDRIEELMESHGIDGGEAFRDDLKVVLESYGREMRLSGSRSFAKLIDEMLYHQKNYFKTKSQSHLRKAKSLEDQARRSVDLILKR